MSQMGQKNCVRRLVQATPLDRCQAGLCVHMVHPGTAWG